MKSRIQSTKKPKSKGLSQTTHKLIDEKYYGQEPIFQDRDMEEIDYLNTLNWYNYMYDQDSEKAKSFVLAYLKESKYPSQTITLFRKSSDIKLPFSLGWTCRQLSLNSRIPVFYKDKILNYIKEFKGFVEEKIEETPEVKIEKPVVDIQKRIKEKASSVIAIFEESCDVFDRTFEIVDVPYDIMTKLEVSAPVAKIIAEKYTPILEELKAAYAGKDKDLNEAYSCYTKPELKKMINYRQAIVTDAERIINTNKAVRKPRKKKEKSASEQVTKAQYKKEDTTFKIKSIDPSNIIGSQQLWVFNTKTRILSVYNSNATKGLAMRRTTLQNFDDATSISKKLRKPEEILTAVLSQGKPSLRKLMSTIKTKDSPANGRLNSDTILLRAIK